MYVLEFQRDEAVLVTQIRHKTVAFGFVRCFDVKRVFRHPARQEPTACVVVVHAIIFSSPAFAFAGSSLTSFVADLLKNARTGSLSGAVDFAVAR